MDARKLKGRISLDSLGTLKMKAQKIGERESYWD